MASLYFQHLNNLLTCIDGCYAMPLCAVVLFKAYFSCRWVSFIVAVAGTFVNSAALRSITQ
jgi:hypothetical protein